MNTQNLRRITLAGSCLLASTVWGHGYVENSRNHLCATGGNSNCGAVQYEPQSVEGPDRFPATGPADGTIAAAGSATWAPLNAAGASRWQKNDITAGANTFHWHFTANHTSRDFRYYITKENWNPNDALSRSQLEAQPFCEFDAGLRKPDVETYHDCNVPARQGYHIILAVWDVGDTAASFYNAIDVQFGGDTDFDENPDNSDGGNNGGDTGGDQNPDDGNGDTTPPDTDDNTLIDIGNIHPMTALDAGDEVQLRLFTEEGERLGSAISFTIASAAGGDRQQWPLEFATYINQYSREVQAGMLDGDGNVVPVRGHNDVYTTASTGIVRTEVNIVMAPDEPTGGEPGSGDSGNNGDTLTYPEGVGQYQKDDIVIGINGNSYRCNIAGWCNGSRTYYEPGEGLAWGDAWTLTETGSAAPTTSPASNDYPAGRGSYQAGTVVRGSDGSNYRCKVPGWCNSSSEYHYAPGTGAASGSAWAKQ